MAKFELKLPTEVIDEIEKIGKNVEKIFGGMTKAGAELVYKKVQNNLPARIARSNMRKNLFLSRTYLTPTDGCINNKVGFAGYFVNEEGKLAPAPLVANLFENGRHDGKYPKHPFFRRSFVKREIETEMFKAQLELSDGLLEK